MCDQPICSHAEMERGVPVIGMNGGLSFGGSFLRSSADLYDGGCRRSIQLPLLPLLLPAPLLLLAAAVAELEGAPFSSAFTSAGRLRLAPALLFGSRGFHSAAERTTRSCASSSTYCHTRSCNGALPPRTIPSRSASK